jgi:pimeloyl-ACP methyl ester carboxylesterase
MDMEYPSSVDPALRLFADFRVPERPRRLIVSMHGWHGAVKTAHPDNVVPPPDPDWFDIQPEMRGRGDASGKPDCNGWELQDVIDAVEHARTHFADRILDPDLVTLRGGSGGGGNVFALLGKFPDYFCRARAECGISDYALWHRNDADGEFRDEMEGAGWIGGSPDTRPEAYLSRSGLATVANLLTPLLIFHGEKDIRVPAEHSRRYTAEALRLGKRDLVTYHEFPGVGTRSHYGNITPEQEAYRRDFGRAFLLQNPRPIPLPRRGRFVVAGYLKTRSFEIILDSVDRVAALDYDLDTGRFDLEAPTARRAELRLPGPGGAWRARAIEVRPGA